MLDAPEMPYISVGGTSRPQMIYPAYAFPRKSFQEMAPILVSSLQLWEGPIALSAACALVTRDREQLSTPTGGHTSS